MRKIVCAVMAAVLIGIVCLMAFIGDECVVMSNIATSDQTRSGWLRIPSSGVDVPLFRVHDDGCCFYGLYNGGKVDMRATDLSTVSIDSVAFIMHEDVSLVLECVEIIDCVQIGDALLSMRGIVHADGDVLIVMCDYFPFVKVWRMTLL